MRLDPGFLGEKVRICSYVPSQRCDNGFVWCVDAEMLQVWQLIETAKNKFSVQRAVI